MATDAESPPVFGADQHCINLLGLSPAPRAALRRAQIHTVEALAQLADGDLLQIRGIGAGSLALIRSELGRWAEQLAPPRPDVPDEPTLAEAWSLPAALACDDTDIRALGLHASIRIGLARAGVATVGALARLTPREGLGVAHIGQVGLDHIRGHLAQYARLEAALAAPGRSEAPVVPAELLDELAAVDLDGIPLSSLNLPRREDTRLLLAGVSTVGALARLPLDALGPYPAAVENVNYYVRWLARRRAPEPRRLHTPPRGRPPALGG